MNKGVKITLRDERVDPVKERTYHYEGGIPFVCGIFEPAQTPLFKPPVYIEGEKNGSTVEVALQWNGRLQRKRVYVRQQHPHAGGRHASGRPALGPDQGHQRLWPQKRHLKGSDANLSGEDVREGLTAVVSVKLVEPQFEGQTKSKLGNSEIRPLVDALVTDKLSTYLKSTLPTRAPCWTSACRPPAPAKPPVRPAT